MDINYNASDFINMKSRIKNEVKRRKYTGSVSSYGNTEYDYTVTPVAGEPVLAEHYNKIAVPLRAINPADVADATVAGAELESVTNPTVLDAKLTVFESKSLTGTSLAATGCNASCTGLCYSSCSGSCKGSCSGGCSSNCGSSCSGRCSGSCSGSCGGNCNTSCSNNCTGSVSDQCMWENNRSLTKINDVKPDFSCKFSLSKLEEKEGI